MVFFQRRNKSETNPPKQIAITSSLVLNHWSKDDPNGNGKIFHWSVARKSKDGESTYRTLRPHDLLDMPAFVQRVSASYAEAESLPNELRKQLASLSLAMAQVIEIERAKVGGNGKDEDIGLNL